MKPCKLHDGNIAPNGYGRFKRDGRTFYAHRVAYQEAHGPIPEGMCVCHRCDVRPCIEPSHLFLGTKGDNARDRTAKGRSAKGIKNRHAKLTEDQVREIRSDPRPNLHIAKDYPVNSRSIGNIKLGRTWTHVTAQSPTT